MHPIFLFNDKKQGNIGINAEDFENEFMNICREHRLKNKARVFAFILTDFHTMEVNDFLLNNLFWNELHVMSGHYLTVFHFDFKSNEVNKLFRKGQADFVREQYEKFFSSLAKTFDTEEFNNINMPAILFFQTERADIIDFFCVELDSKKLQQNMDDMKDYITDAVASVKDVTSDNLRNSREIYKLLKTSVQGTETLKVWTAGLRKVVKLYEIFR